MYPILFELGGYPVSSFGVMMIVAFLVATRLTGVRLREYGHDPELATKVLFYAVPGGIAGSKLYYAIDVALRTGEPFGELLLSREGVTWYGGLGGGMILSVVACRVHGLPLRIYWNSVCIGAAVGQAIGRLGCFLNGDDYGRATELAWGMTFPRGSPATLEPVHPTQLYEFAWLMLAAGLMWRRRHASPWLGGEYLMLTGSGRFLIEFLRENPRVLLGLTEAQWIGLVAFGIGVGTWLHDRARAGPTAGRAREASP